MSFFRKTTKFWTTDKRGSSVWPAFFWKTDKHVALCVCRYISVVQVIVVDEGEGSEDSNTLEEIHQIVQEHFRDKTVITMTSRSEKSHRRTDLQSVCFPRRKVAENANKVILFRSGNVEYGSPEEIVPRCQNLLQGRIQCPLRKSH